MAPVRSNPDHIVLHVSGFNREYLRDPHAPRCYKVISRLYLIPFKPPEPGCRSRDKYDFLAV